MATEHGPCVDDVVAVWAGFDTVEDKEILSKECGLGESGWVCW